jgi:glyoxylase-like metal-dependent hydrolase (beta-lactamase superfamily II)
MMEGGAATNDTVAIGADGIILVDTMFHTTGDKLKAAIEAKSKLPIKYVIESHHHSDAIGGTESFAKPGTTIVAQEGTLKRVSDVGAGPGGVIVQPVPKVARPTKTYKDTMTISIKGVTAILVHTPPAHTDNDTYVYFPEANVLHAGTLFNAEGYPGLDTAAGGSIDNIIAAADSMLKHVNDQTKIVPGHGPVQSKADLVAYRAMLVDARDRVAKLKAQQKSEQETVNAKPLDSFDKRWANGPMANDRFVRVVYDTLTSVYVARVREGK